MLLLFYYCLEQHKDVNKSRLFNICSSLPIYCRLTVGFGSMLNIITAD